LDKNHLEFLFFLRDNESHSEKKQTFGQPRDAKLWVLLTQDRQTAENSKTAERR